MWSFATYLCLALLVLAKTCQGQSYVAEGYFVVDDSAVQNYVREITTTEDYSVKYTRALTNIRKDIDYAITQLNILFASLSQYDLRLEIRVRRLDILNSNIITTFLPGTYYVADSEASIYAFQRWLNLQNAYNNTQYDFALHWTEFNLYGTTGLSSKSYTNVASVCAASALSVVEFGLTYGDIVGTAHSLGFLLGASNDGATSTNIMVIVNGPTLANRWSFSSCSASSFKDFLKLPTANCLLTTNSLSTKPSVSYSTYSGDVFNPDVICQRTLNDSRSYMCKSVPQIYQHVPPRGNVVCSQIFCRVPNTMICTPAYATDGMICDNQKRCTAGQCVSYQTPYVDTNCVWGDQKKLEFTSIPFYGSCQTYIDTYGALNCYSSDVSESCCSTCKKYNTGTVGCEYGDKSKDCVKYTRDQVCPVYKNTLCCNYCNGYVGKRSIPDDQFPVLNITKPIAPTKIAGIEPYEEQQGKPFSI